MVRLTIQGGGGGGWGTQGVQDICCWPSFVHTLVLDHHFPVCCSVYTSQMNAPDCLCVLQLRRTHCAYCLPMLDDSKIVKGPLRCAGLMGHVCTKNTGQPRGNTACTNEDHQHI